MTDRRRRAIERWMAARHESGLPVLGGEGECRAAAKALGGRIPQVTYDAIAFAFRMATAQRIAETTGGTACSR